ncbi:MAG: VPLPA-CTERM sorting domain-containing protein [Pseudomonadota bacterium]
MIDSNLVRSLTAAALLCSGVTAQGGFIDALSSLTLTDVTTSGSATIEFDGAFYTGAAIVNDTSGLADFDFFFGATPDSALATFGANTAFASADEDGSDATAIVGDSGDALASGAAELDFTVDGTGEVTLTFAAILSATFVDAGPDAYAQASAVVYDVFGGLEELFLFADGTSDATTAMLTLTLDVDGLAFGFLGIETGAFADTGVAAVVPLPAAGWLFLGGLAGLTGLRRRRCA